MKEDLVIENLLNEVKKFNKTIANSNIFTILNKERDERTHCRILRYLIDKYWAEFCKQFLSGINEDLKYCVCEQHIEKLLDCDEDKEGSIDILAETQNYVIAIEVKVYAEDQRIQLLRYYNYYCKDEKKFKLIYLTPTGREASYKSTKCEKTEGCKVINCKQKLSKKDYDVLNYHDISSWLATVIETTESTQDSYYIAKCYKEVLDKEEAGMDAVEEILKNNNNLNAAKVICDSYQTALDKIRDMFFDALTEELRKKDFLVERVIEKKNEAYKTINDVNNTALIVTDESTNLKYTICYSTNLYIRKNPENNEMTDWCYICRDWFDKISDTYNSKEEKKVAVDVKNFEGENNPVLAWYFSSNKDRIMKNLVDNIIKEFNLSK